ncbi:MAG: hypothetical protein ACP5VQ_05765 [Phycisphaerae bacterium]
MTLYAGGGNRHITHAATGGNPWPVAPARTSGTALFPARRDSGAIGFDGIQSLEDLRDNWNRLLDAAGLTPEERKEAVTLFYSRVETLPGTEVGGPR